MSAAAGVLSVARSGTTTVATLDRADKRNALSADLVEALLAAVARAAEDGTRLLVLKGAGRGFCAGFDMADIDAQSEGDLLRRFVRIEQLLQAVRHAPFDTLALAHGRNFGAGVDLFCACARRVATPDATFRMPGLRFGIVLGTRLFAERVGAERARRVLQESATFTSAEGRAWGFVDDIVPEGEFAAAIARAQEAASALAPRNAATLYRVTAPDRRDADLAELVRSAAEPGLKERIKAYLAERA